MVSAVPNPNDMEITTINLEERHESEKALNISEFTIIFKNIFYCDYWNMKLTGSKYKKSP